MGSPSHYAASTPLLTCLCLSLTVCVPSRLSTEENLFVDARLSVSGSFHSERWNELVVEVRNTGADFRGQIEARGVIDRDNLDGITYRSPFEIPRGGVRAVSIPVRPAGWEAARIWLRSPDVSRRFDVPLPVPVVDTRHLVQILSVGARPSSLDPLVKTFDAYLKREHEQALSDAAETPAPKPPVPAYRVVEFEPRRLPTHWAAYDAFEIVLLYGSSLATATPAAVEALSRWVETGGTLVAFAGADWASALPPRLRDLLGVRRVDPGAKMHPALVERIGTQAAQGI